MGVIYRAVPALALSEHRLHGLSPASIRYWRLGLGRVQSPTMRSWWLQTLFAAQTPLLSNHDKCQRLSHDFKFPNTTILNATLVLPGKPSNPSHSPYATLDEPYCKVEALINTSSTSAVRMEAWLPDTWYGRLLAIGNGGLAGCETHLLHDASVFESAQLTRY